MPTVNKVTEVLFDQIKTELEFVDPTTAAMKNHLSVKTILQIKGSENYKDYEAMKKAQHPPTTFSMRDMLVDINNKLDTLLNYTRENRLF